MNQRRKQRAERRGTTVVETAFVLPVFIFFMLSLIEFGHAQMVQNVLRSACRTGARMGSTDGNSTDDVKAHVRQILDGAINQNAVQVFVKDASSFDSGSATPTSGSQLEAMPNMEVEDAEERQLFMVRAKVNYNDIALVPMPFMNGVVLEGQAFMRHE